MDGWNRIMNNMQSQQPQRNQPGFNQNQYHPGQQQNSSRMMQPNQQQYNQQNFRAQQPNNQWQQTMNMVRAQRPVYQNNISGFSQDFNHFQQPQPPQPQPPQPQPLTYPSSFPPQQQPYHPPPLDQMPPPGGGGQQPLVVGPGQPGQPGQPGVPVLPPGQPLHYGGPGPPVMVAGPHLNPQPQHAVVVQQHQPPHQPNPALVAPNQIIYQANSQQSYLQPPGTGGVTAGPAHAPPPPMVISATPAPSQPVVQLVAGPQPGVVMYSSHDPVIAPTPALITAPTPAPAPIVVNTALPMAAPAPAPSSNNYNFDPSGLTPAQQLAYAQAQQQHQQQHLKKMRQRLPHVSGRELQSLHKQIKDLQHKQHMQTLQTLRLAQVQEKQAFNYLDSAFKTRQKPNTYHRVNFQLKVYCSFGDV